MSLSLKALVSAGMEEAANNDASNMISLFRAILTRRSLAQLPIISFGRQGQSQAETPMGLGEALCMRGAELGKLFNDKQCKHSVSSQH
jgi:hypothetical protein